MTGCISPAKRLRHNGLLLPRKPPSGTYSDSFWPACIPSCKIAFFFFFLVFLFLLKIYLCFTCVDMAIVTCLHG